MPDEVTPRRFPPPWDIEEANASCFIVNDNTRVCLLRAGSRPAHGGQLAHPRRSPPHRRQHRQAADAAGLMPEGAECCRGDGCDAVAALLIVQFVKGFAVVDRAQVWCMGPGHRWMFLANRLRFAPFA